MSLDVKDAYFHFQVAQDSWDLHSKGWHINTRSYHLGCPWLPALLRNAWMWLSPLCDRWESVYSTRRLAHSGPVRGVLTSHNTLLLSHLGCLGLRVNFAKSILSPSQRVLFLGTVFDSVPVRSNFSRKCWALWQRLSRYFSLVCFTCDPFSSGWSRGFHLRLGVTDAPA